MKKRNSMWSENVKTWMNLDLSNKDTTADATAFSWFEYYLSGEGKETTRLLYTTRIKAKVGRTGYHFLVHIVQPAIERLEAMSRTLSEGGDQFTHGDHNPVKIYDWNAFARNVNEGLKNKENLFWRSEPDVIHLF